MLIARVIDITDDHVVLSAEGKYYTISWPGTEPTPIRGAVYELALEPTVTIGRQLTAPSLDARTVGPDSDALRWSTPIKGQKTRYEILQARHIIRRAVRDYLDHEGFIEIDMPLLVRGTTPDSEIESFALGDRYLVTSTEYQIKRMEIGGFNKCYTLTQNFRKGDQSQYRNPEFTMLEWARVGQDLTTIERDVETFTRQAYEALGGTGALPYQGHTIDLSAPWDRLTIRQALKTYTGAVIDDFSTPSLLKALKDIKIDIRDEWADNPFFLFTIMLDHLQQFLGFDRPVFLTEWPVFLTSSTAKQPSGIFAERSELFIAGVEISDGFPTLTDPTQQETGFNNHQDRRNEDGKDSVTLDQRFLTALHDGLPSGAGMALGFDRLVMILTDQAQIKNVLAFGWDEL